ncbi:MAG: exopolyphosphatase [Kangiellaceae bacterium]|jgi:exopolyphosphatase/guanosine-5'-triphosphate,3'-diphosphate pyrophosphatase|nr:exopolyphosphatase [Kangiellaceae bacterium]
MTVDQSPIVAAIDLGSNSFHLTIAKLEHNNLQIISRLKEKVRLAEGLGTDNVLDREAQQRALTCLSNFKQRIGDFNPKRVRVVGTFTLRKAKNSQKLITEGQKILGYPIEIISGKEEARLIYEGVSHFQHSKKKQLIIDIGGGSTEFSIGEAYDPILLDSLQMGCVSFTKRYFSNNKLTKANFKRAITAAQVELVSIADLYLREGWELCIGTSGTIESILDICREADLGRSNITGECLTQLQNKLIDLKTIEQLNLPSLSENRREILPAGLAILIAIFKSLKLTHMNVSPAALREGVIYELVGIEKPQDIKERAIKGLLTRYHIDFDQARRVNQTALTIWQMVAKDWKVDTLYFKQLLNWAARCHEIGLTINYAKQQKHGEYLLLNTDIAGFSVQQQSILALMIRSFRRKFPLHRFELLDDRKFAKQLIAIARILRLAVILNHSRRDFSVPELCVSADKKTMSMNYPPGYLKQHSLLRAELEQEQYYLDLVGLKLEYS